MTGACKFIGCLVWTLAAALIPQASAKGNTYVSKVKPGTKLTISIKATDVQTQSFTFDAIHTHKVRYRLNPGDQHTSQHLSAWQVASEDPSENSYYVVLARKKSTENNEVFSVRFWGSFQAKKGGGEGGGTSKGKPEWTAATDDTRIGQIVPRVLYIHPKDKAGRLTRSGLQQNWGDFRIESSSGLNLRKSVPRWSVRPSAGLDVELLTLNTKLSRVAIQQEGIDSPEGHGGKYIIKAELGNASVTGCTPGLWPPDRHCALRQWSSRLVAEC